ncbi:MAG: class I SAM-dependent methyltransferase [Candidatus Sungbacteria bacterium]|nr:class I SAM-dependent methyltransferase [Candidatus Sungbacteria bacterium]
MKKPAYITVEEMRMHPEWVREKEEVEGGTRFMGTTEPSLALQYFPKNGKILECGPHTGAFTKILQDHNYTDIHAVDFYDALKFADRTKMAFTVIDLNTEKIPYPNNSFDGVAAWGIGEHMENPYHFMREVYRVIKPGAKFIFALPNVFHVTSRLLFLKKGTFPRWNESNNHITVFTKDTFKKTFLRYFDLEKTIYTKPGVFLFGKERFKHILPANEWFGNYVIYVMEKK